MASGYRNIKELLAIDEKRNGPKIILPDFQRQFVWKADQQRDLICSLLAGVPIGSFLIQEAAEDAFCHKPLCYNFFSKKKKSDNSLLVGYLLDGQQRLSTIKSVISDIFHDKFIQSLKDNEYDMRGIENTIDLFKRKSGGARQPMSPINEALKHRWFIKIDSIPDNESVIDKLSKLFGQGKEESAEPADYEDFIHYYPLKSGSMWLKDDDLRRNACDQKRIPLWIFQDDRAGFRKIANEVILHALTKKDKEKYPLDTEETTRESITQIANVANEITSFIADRILGAEVPCQTISANSIGFGVALFETVNTKGTHLDTYDLIVSRYGRNETGDSLNTLIYNFLSDTDESFKKNEKLKYIVHEYEEKNFKDYAIKYEDDIYGIWDDKNNLPSPNFRKLFVNCLSLQNYKNIRPDEPLKIEAIKQHTILQSGHNRTNNASLAITDTIIDKNWQTVVEGLMKIFEMLHIECGLLKLSDLRYQLLVLPLFWCLVSNQDGDVFSFENRKTLNKCQYWYWVSLFTARYQRNQNQLSIRDCERLRKFLSPSEEPFSAIFTDALSGDSENELCSVLDVLNHTGRKAFCDQQSYPDHYSNLPRAACLQFLLSIRPHDWVKKKDKNQAATVSVVRCMSVKREKEEGSDLKTDDLDVHHIIPKSASSSSRTDRNKMHNLINSPMNLTYISKQVNVKMSDGLTHTYENRYAIDGEGHFIYNEKSNRETKESKEKFHNILEDIDSLAGADLSIDDKLQEFLELRFDIFRDKVISKLKSLLL